MWLTSVLGEDFKVVVLGGKAYKVSPPTIATICKGIQYLVSLLIRQHRAGGS